MDSDICPTLKQHGIYLPAVVLTDKRLNRTDERLLCTVHALEKNSSCFATNRYLALSIGRSEVAVSKSISKLKELDWLVEGTSAEGTRSLKTTIKEREKDPVTILAKHQAPADLSVLKQQTPNPERLKTSDTSVSEGYERISSSDTSVSVQGYERIPRYKIDLKEDLKKEEEEKQLLPSHLFCPTGPQSPEMETEVLQIYSRHFPNYHPTVYQLDAILTSVQDKVTWSAACDIWALRGYQPRNVRGLLETYETELKRKKDPPKPKLSPHPVVTNDPCPYCSTGMPDRCSYIRQFGVCRW